MKERVPRLAYCQYLLVSPSNYTLTTFADHCEQFSPDAINRYLRGERITPRLLWENVRDQVVPTPQGYVVFDEPVLDKNASFAIALVRRQYSGNTKAVIKAIGVVPGVYLNPRGDQFWLIDYRIYEPAGDARSKLEHVHELLRNVGDQKPLPFHAVLMAPWYATKDLILFIESLQQHYSCPLKDNRQVADPGGQRPYGRGDALEWSPEERAHGKRIQIKGVPNDPKGRRFRVEVSTHRTDWVGTTAPTQHSTEATQEACGWRWKIEQWPGEGKQLTGLERCQCRTARIQRNHIGCACLVWVRLKALAAQTGRPGYHLKHGLLDDYLIYQLKTPSLKMCFA